ncbi:MAG: hypothetical protein KAW92_11340 [Candidatus Cloacimonetes bacterium]|nr:hypothetical protein [Candidatus Cloacimonadota bacterium]
MAIIFLLIGAAIGGLFSWYITHQYYKKSTKDLKEIIDNFSKDLQESNTLKYFEFLLENSKWKKEFIEHEEIWVAEKNNTFQIYPGKRGSEFGEGWTTMYPSQETYRYSVYLKINNTPIKELTFISLDGSRIFVPIPDKKIINEKACYFWNMNSLGIKVCKIIGHYYIHKSIAGVAEMSKIELIN